MLLHQADKLLIGPLTTPIMAEFNLNRAQMGFVTTGALLVGAVMYPLWGYLYDRYARAKLLAKTLDEATGKLLDENKSPSRRTGELDNRGSQFYLAMYWAQALAAQTEDKELATRFASLAKALSDNEQKIVDEFKAVQGKPADIGGYYLADPAKVQAVMRPSATLNSLLQAASAA